MGMLLDKINQSLRRDNWQAFIRQMWLPIIFAVSLGIASCMITIASLHQDLHLSLKNLATAIAFFGAGFVVSTLLQLTKQGIVLQRKDKHLAAKIILHTGCYLLLLIDIIYLFNHTISTAGTIAHCVVFGSIVVGVFVLPMLYHNDDKHLARFVMDMGTNFLLFGFAYLVIRVALSFLFIGVTELFNIDIDLLGDSLVLEILFYIFILIGTPTMATICLLLVPNPHKEGMVSDFTKKVSKLLGKYIFLPVFALYIVVLYAYILKIVFIWELPNGTVSWITTIMMMMLLAIVLLLYPTLYDTTQEQSRFWKSVKRILPYLALPALILMTVGIARRINDYGWTIARAYALIGNIWFYLVCGMLILASYKEKKVLTQIILSFCIIALLSSVIPGINVAQSTQRILTRQVEQLIANAPEPFPDKQLTGEELIEWLDQQDETTARAIYSKIEYLYRTYDNESIERWCSDFTYCYRYSLSAEE